jgi:hypothetical protein
MMFPQHQSHSSHASHVSHASSSPGIGLPDLPNPNFPPTPAPASDPKYLACTRASSGFGVNDIASELEQVFGMPENDAVNMAQQALTAVFGGGHYCDGYLGDHQ